MRVLKQSLIALMLASTLTLSGCGYNTCKSKMRL